MKIWILLIAIIGIGWVGAGSAVSRVLDDLFKRKKCSKLNPITEGNKINEDFIERMFEASQPLNSIESSFNEMSFDEKSFDEKSFDEKSFDEDKLSSNQSFHFQVMTTFANDFEKILRDYEEFENFFKDNDFQMTKTVIQKLKKNQIMWNEFRSMHRELFVKKSNSWSITVDDFYEFTEKVKRFFLLHASSNPKRFIGLNAISEILIVSSHSNENNLYLLAAVVILNLIFGGRLMLSTFEDFLIPIHSAFAANLMKTNFVPIYLTDWISSNSSMTHLMDFTKSETSGLQIAAFSILFHAVATILLLKFFPKCHLKLLVAAAVVTLCLQLKTTFDVWKCWSVSPFNLAEMKFSNLKIEMYPLQMQVLLVVTCCVALYGETSVRCRQKFEKCKAARFVHLLISHAFRILSLFAIMIFLLPSFFFAVCRFANVDLQFWPYKLICD